jgi:hypothetical protein
MILRGCRMMKIISRSISNMDDGYAVSMNKMVHREKGINKPYEINNAVLLGYEKRLQHT